MKDDANRCETTTRTVRARTYCISAFQGLSARSTQHSIKKVLRVTKPLNVFDETPCITGRAVKSFPQLTGWERLLG